jgi:hypothetical protein
MDKHGYDWEAFLVTTDDDYILTTFHILGKSGEKKTKKSKATVLMQHGAQIDAAAWVGDAYGKPF